MKPNELRIGNYVSIRNVKFNKDYLSYVVEIGDGDVLLACNEEAERYTMVDVCAEPLTVELLGYLGFMMETEFDGFSISHYKDGLRLFFVKDSALSDLFYYEVWYFDNHDNSALIRNRIDSVHELQNIYYAIKGSELEININIQRFPKI